MNNRNNNGNAIILNLNEMMDYLVVAKMRTKIINRKRYVNILSITFTASKGKDMQKFDDQDLFFDNKCAILPMEKFELLFDDANANAIGMQVFGRDKYVGFCYGGKIQINVIK